MKKIYLLLLSLSFFAVVNAQSPIVTIDRANGTGPTASGNPATISSIGLTRGAGVTLLAGGTHFNTKDWNSNNRVQAVANNDYLQWSVTAGGSYEVEVTEVDIRLRRSSTGPSNWRLYYSLDNFATAGTAVAPPQSLPATTNVNYNLDGLSIVSGDAGTITFRLYAWGASSNSGWLRVINNNAWADFGITQPGVRLTGNITTTTPNSNESNIIASLSFDPTDNIDYISYNATSGLTTSNALKIGEFTIQDGGDDLTDPDALSTILTDIDFSVIGDSNIAAIALFDGTTNISEITTITPIVFFSNINGGAGLVAPDNSSKSFDVYATFNSVVTDNEQLQLNISSATADDTSGSIFAAFDAGGASTPVVGDDNRIEVTASEIVYTQQPTDTYQLETMTPYPVVNAVDANNNLDVDYNNTVDVTSSGMLTPSSITYSITNGIGVFNSIVFAEQDSDIFLTASPSGLPSLDSNLFDVLGPLVTIAIQDFDNSNPDWGYSSDISFFDNNWSVDGYYDVIHLDDATPLDYSFFSNNIFGENDLNDEGDNGTINWATLTFDTIDVSEYTNTQVRFDWQIIGYSDANNDAQYRVFFDGVSQGYVYLIEGGVTPPDGSGSVVVDVPDTVVNVSLEVRIRNNGENGFSGFDNFKIVSVFDGLLYANGSWTPFPPSDTTGSETAFVKNGNYVVDSEILLDNLYIENGAITTVDPGQSLSINTDLYSNGTLEMNSISTSYSSLIIDGKSLGQVVYNRYVNNNAATGGNDLISAPVTGQTFGDFASNNPNIFSNPANPTEKLFGPFDKTTDTYLTYDTAIPAEASVVLSPAVGYRAATDGGSTLAFTGDVNTEEVNIAIVNSGPTNPEWNLIGNPYPSYLSLADFLDANNTLFDPVSSGIYGYDGDASDGWTIWNQAYSDANPDAVLTPGQGFLVASVPSGGTISYIPSMRRNGDSDDFISGRTSNNSLIEYLKLELSNSSQSYSTDFYFTDNASLGLDPGYDASIYSGMAPSFSIYSHLIENNEGRDYAIQSLGYNDFTDVSIPLGINSQENQEITVSIVQSTLPETIQVYLDDVVANTSTLLNDGDFTISPDSNMDGTGRFFLRFSDASLSTEELFNNNIQVFATITPKSLFVKGYLDSLTSVKIYDLQGRIVLNTSINSTSNYNQIDLSNLVSGVYVVSVSNNTLSKTQKIIIK